MTSTGVTAGIDLALGLVERYASPDLVTAGVEMDVLGIAYVMSMKCACF